MLEPQLKQGVAPCIAFSCGVSFHTTAVSHLCVNCELTSGFPMQKKVTLTVIAPSNRLPDTFIRYAIITDAVISQRNRFSDYLEQVGLIRIKATSYQHATAV